MKKISVIVPVYNAANYLEKCVDSILKQTFSDFELLLVDDGSTDSSVELCDKFMKQDVRVKVFHKKNGGHASARNYGIDKSFETETEYITFIDSDDWVDCHYLEYLYQAILETNGDISVCNFERVNNRNETTDLKYTIACYTPEQLWCNWRINATLPCAKLYKKELFRGKRWPEKCHDDEHMTYKLLFACKEIPFVNIGLYRYFYNTNSVMASGWSIKHIDSIDAIRERKEYFKKNGFENAYRLDCRLYIEELYNTIFQLKNLDEDSSDLYTKLKKELKIALIRYGKKGGITWKSYKYMYIFAYPFMKIFLYIDLIIKRKSK